MALYKCVYYYYYYYYYYYSLKILKQYMYITTSTEKRIRYSVTMRTTQYGLVNSAMGQIPCSTERISCLFLFSVGNFISGCSLCSHLTNCCNLCKVWVSRFNLQQPAWSSHCTVNQAGSQIQAGSLTEAGGSKRRIS